MKQQTALLTCLPACCTSAFGASQDTLNKETLLDLAPRISIEEPDMCSFPVEGTIGIGASGWRFGPREPMQHPWFWQRFNSNRPIIPDEGIGQAGDAK